MRKSILTFLLCVVAVTAQVYCNAQSTLIHYWNFNSLSTSMYTPTITAIPVDYTDLAGANARILFAKLPTAVTTESTYIESFASGTADYDTVNFRMSATAGNLIRAHNPCDSMELLFYTPSTHFKNLVFTFGTSRASNGAKYQNYDYSIDSGVNWITTGLSMVTDSVWNVFQRITLTTTNTAVNNNSKLVFRVTWTNTTTTTMGNNKFDNVSLDGDTISTLPSGINEPLITETTYTLYPNPVTNELKITASADGTRQITITSITGQKVYESTENKQQFSVNTTSFLPGLYFISMKDNSSGSVTTRRFLKE